MKFNMICTKFDQKLKKPKFWTFEFFLKPKNEVFCSHFPALELCHESMPVLSDN